MTRGVRFLGAAALVTAVHMAALLALARMAPDLPQMQEGPRFMVVLAPPITAPQRRPRQLPEPPERRATGPPGHLGGRGISHSSPARGESGAEPATPGPDQAWADPVQAARVRAALRQTFGCAQPAMVRLNEAERAACLERFARGTEGAPYRPPLMDGVKRRDLERAGAQRAADRAYRDSVTPPLGIDTTGGGAVMNPLPDL